ncbi:glycosyltransferase family protein [Cerina litoralis]|nr:glycosyltransferase [Cerina litoralis]
MIYWKHFKVQNEREKVINWCYWPKGYRDWKYLQTKGKLLFDSDHNILNDPNTPKDDQKDRERLLVEIGSRANFVLSASRTMLKWFSQFPNVRGFLAMNGVITDKVNNSKIASTTPNKEIVYCGTLSKWIKKEWLFRLISEHPEWTFHIVGRDYLCNLSEELMEFENVVLYGYLPRKKADSVIGKADVAIALYEKEAHIDVSSMKIFDYLKMGKKVVTNNFHPHLLQDYESLIYCADSYDKFQEYINDDAYLAPKDEVIASFLKNKTWEQIVNDILSRIED